MIHREMTIPITVEATACGMMAVQPEVGTLATGTCMKSPFTVVAVNPKVKYHVKSPGIVHATDATGRQPIYHFLT